MSRRELFLDIRPEPGYHTLTLRVGERAEKTLVLAAPARCYFPESEARAFGVAAQLYSLPSERNLGIGDIADVSAASTALAAAGVRFVGLNPLHALFEGSADNFSPYSPSSRLAWSSLIIAHDTVPEFQSAGAQALFKSESFQRRITAAVEADLVDYANVWPLKLELFEELFRALSSEEYAARRRELDSFAETCPPGMREYALYAALREELLAKDPANWGWPAWPKEFRHPQSAAVTDFVKRKSERVRFFLYLQFLAQTQLDALGRELVSSGVELGLYLDLALGANIGGAETWWRQELYAFKASMGAPPDELGPLGQNWGLPPLVPARLREARMEPFREAVALAMSAATALRIDHIMSLFRLFWIPEGETAKDGAYVRYPFEELLAVVCIESGKKKCIVVGEDLGTVPDEVRAGMKERGILSYKVLYFMHENRKFLAAADYPEVSLVVTSTHDLPTLRTFWSGSDIELRKELDLYPTEEVYPLAKSWRKQDRAGLFERMTAEGFTEIPKPDSRDLTKKEIINLHAFLARSTCYLQAIQIEDLERQLEQVNVPGTVNEHPNWRRKMKRPLEKIITSRFSAELLGAVRRERSNRG